MFAKFKLEKLPYYKNILVLTVSFMVNFTGYMCIQNLQSSIHKNLGTTSLWTLYLCFVLSSLFLPSFVIKILGTKWTLVVASFFYPVYIAAQLYPHYYTLVPTGGLVGLAAGLLWTSQTLYVTRIGELYAQHFKKTIEASVAKFFSLFFLGMATSQIWGNIISSTVFSIGVVNESRSDEFLSSCGINFCSSFAENVTSANSGHVSEEVKVEELHSLKILSYICLSCSLLSVAVLALFLKPVTSVSGSLEKSSLLQDLGATGRQIIRPKQLLLIPLTLLSGLHPAFFIGDVTAAYISCGMGVHKVGYFMMCYGISDAITAGLIGYLVKAFGQIPAFILGFASNLSALLLLLFWTPAPTDSSFCVAILVAALAGASNGVWNTQISVLYSMTFTDNCKAAFSNFHLWKPLGYSLAFFLSTYVCLQAKTYTVMSFLLVGIIGFGLVQILKKS